MAESLEPVQVTQVRSLGKACNQGTNRNSDARNEEFGWGRRWLSVIQKGRTKRGNFFKSSKETSGNNIPQRTSGNNRLDCKASDRSTTKSQLHLLGAVLPLTTGFTSPRCSSLIRKWWQISLPQGVMWALPSHHSLSFPSLFSVSSLILITFYLSCLLSFFPIRMQQTRVWIFIHCYILSSAVPTHSRCSIKNYWVNKWMNDWDMAEQFFSFNTADIWSQITHLGACPRLCGMCGSVAGL